MLYSALVRRGRSGPPHTAENRSSDLVSTAPTAPLVAPPVGICTRWLKAIIRRVTDRGTRPMKRHTAYFAFHRRFLADRLGGRRRAPDSAVPARAVPRPSNTESAGNPHSPPWWKLPGRSPSRGPLRVWSRVSYWWNTRPSEVGLPMFRRFLGIFAVFCIAITVLPAIAQAHDPTTTRTEITKQEPYQKR